LRAVARDGNAKEEVGDATKENSRGGGAEGFTLIELMIALFILSLVVAGYVAANLKAQQNSEEMNERTIAIQDANHGIEQMRNATRTGTFPTNITNLWGQNSHITGYNNLTNEVITVTYGTSISNQPLTSNPLDVNVTVTWKSYTGRQDTEAVQTYITQR